MLPYLTLSFLYGMACVALQAPLLHWLLPRYRKSIAFRALALLPSVAIFLAGVFAWFGLMNSQPFTQDSQVRLPCFAVFFVPVMANFIIAIVRDDRARKQGLVAGAQSRGQSGDAAAMTLPPASKIEFSALSTSMPDYSWFLAVLPLEGAGMYVLDLRPSWHFLGAAQVALGLALLLWARFGKRTTKVFSVASVAANGLWMRTPSQMYRQIPWQEVTKLGSTGIGFLGMQLVIYRSNDVRFIGLPLKPEAHIQLIRAIAKHVPKDKFDTSLLSLIGPAAPVKSKRRSG
jgi:hypothetical protein